MPNHSILWNNFFSANIDPKQGLEGHLPFSNREMAVMHLRRYLTDPQTMQAMRRFLYQQHPFNVSRLNDHAVIEAMATRLMQAQFALPAAHAPGTGKAVTSTTAATTATPDAAASTSPVSPGNKQADKADSRSNPTSSQPTSAPKNTDTSTSPHSPASSTMQTMRSPIVSSTTPATGVPASPDLSLPASASLSAPALAEMASPAMNKEEKNLKKKTLSLRWMQKEAFCGDSVQLIGEGTALDEPGSATVEIIHPEKGVLNRLDGSTTTSFPNNIKEVPFVWEVKDVSFAGPHSPQQYNITAKISAGGLTAMAEVPLTVKRVPDIPRSELKTTKRGRCPCYVWQDAKGEQSFEAGPNYFPTEGKVFSSINEDKVVDVALVKQYPQIYLDEDGKEYEENKTYVGHYTGLPPVDFDTELQVAVEGNQLNIIKPIRFIKSWSVKILQMSTGVAGWHNDFFARKVGTSWQYYNPSPEHPEEGEWLPIPEKCSIEDIVPGTLIQEGNEFRLRENCNVIWKWPETLKDFPEYDQKMQQFLHLIEHVWDNRLELHRQGCQSSDKKCCSWKLHITPQITDDPNAWTVYLTIGEEWERSDDTQWYLANGEEHLAPHEFGHLLGAPDEYQGDGAYYENEIMAYENSIMACDSLKVYPRHLRLISPKLGEIINQAIGRNFSFEIRESDQYENDQQCYDCGKWIWPSEFELKGHSCYNCFFKRLAPINL